MKRFIACALLLAGVIAVDAAECKFETKKGPCAAKAVEGTDYCRRRYVEAQVQKIRAEQDKLNKNEALKGCTKLDKAGKPCIHKAPEGKDICLVHQARENAKNELKAKAKTKDGAKADKKAKKDKACKKDKNTKAE